MKCNSEKDLHAHHIIPWKKDKIKMLDLDNGITLCRSCHSREERLLELSKGKNNLKRITWERQQTQST